MIDGERGGGSGSRQDGGHDFGRLHRETVQILMPVQAGAEVDLCDRIDTTPTREVDEQRHLRSPAFDERQLFDDAASDGVLTGQRLVQTGQFGEEQRDERAGHQFGRPSAAAVVGGARVAALHHRQIG